MLGFHCFDETPFFFFSKCRILKGYITNNAKEKPQQMSLLKIREYGLDIPQSQLTRDLKEYGYEKN